MTEIPLQNNISKVIAKDFEKGRKNYPNCQCGNQINPKILKMDLKSIYYGICEKCDRINFYKDFSELNQSKDQQRLQKIPKNVIKKDFEEYLFAPIPDNSLEYYSTSFDELITKIQLLHEIKQLIKISVIKEA